jgi:hypothetical protein
LKIVAYGTAAKMLWRGLIWLVQSYVARTTTKDDDKALARAVAWADPVLRVLEVLRRVTLGLSVGPTARTQPIARSIPPGRLTVPYVPVIAPPPGGVEPMKPLSVPPPAGATVPYEVIRPVADEGEGEKGGEPKL